MVQRDSSNNDNPFGRSYWADGISFCPKCGHNLSPRILESEDRPRLVCESCGYIFYQNPKIVSSVLPIKEGGVILLKRGIPPQRGAWTFPAGYMEMDETAEAAAVREAKEETNLDVASLTLLNVYSRPPAGIVIVTYVAQVVGGEPRIGRETLEIASFLPKEIPWDTLAFESTKWALQDWTRTLSE